MNLQTTLNIIRAAKPCADGWAKLLKSLPPHFNHDEPIAFLHILKSNTLDDAIWALRCVLPEQEKERDREARLFACDCAERVLRIYEVKFPEDKRPRECIEMARRFVNGNATPQELAADYAAAYDAASVAASVAGRAAGSAASWAATDAAWAAAGVAWAAASVAGRAASWAAAWAAAYDAAGVAGRAAGRVAKDAENDKHKAQFIVRFCTQEASK